MKKLNSDFFFQETKLKVENVGSVDVEIKT